jgi:DNA-binding SARP family transcriptional activator
MVPLPMARARICLLGGFEAYRADGGRTMLPTRKAEALLAVVALGGGAPCPRERLAAMLWGDRGEAQARHSLSQGLTSIRTGLGEDCLVATREGIALAPGRLAVDALAFQELAKDAGFDALAEAAELYRGPLLDGLALHEEGFTEWLATARRQLQDRAVETLLRLARAARARGDEPAARAALERAVALEPLSEDAHRDLIRLHLDHGRAAEAVRRYDACAELLRHELQVEPGPELAALRREALARGRSAPGAPEAGGERKQATAIAMAFAPAAGAPSDPEDLEVLLGDMARRAAEALREQGGHVLRASVEGVAAVFGAPVALEDHAARACHAALAVLRALAPGQARGAVGVAGALDSGEVLLRGGTVFGTCLQRAARIAAMAPTGAVVATEATVALTRGRFHVARAEPVPLDPAAPALPLYRLEGARAWEYGPIGPDRGFVERQPELAAIAAAIAPVEHGAGRLVALVGEAGVGKSRLVREFIARALPPGWRAVLAGADPQSADVAYSSIAGLLRGYFGITGEDTTETVRQRVMAAVRALDPGLAPLVDAPLLALFDAQEPGPDWTALEPAQRRRRLAEAVRALLHRHATAQPLLIVLEDLHWLDAASRQLVESLVESLAASRLALLVNYRPEFVHGWPGLGHYRQIRVDPLSAEGARALLDRMLGQDPGTDPLKRRLAARAGGNPFFLEECVHSVEAAGLLLGEPGGYRVLGDPEAVALPATVQAVIGARLDRLAPDDKRLLQIAAVIGSEPPAALLRAVCGLAEEAFEGGLGRLQAAEFLVPLRMVPDPLYRFRHALTHEVVQASLLRQDRRELHERVLRTLECGHGEGTRSAELLAFHATRAEAWEAAAEYGRRAGMRAAARAANREAVSLYRQALTALQRLPEGPGRGAAEVDLHLEIRNALFVLGEPEEIPAHLEAAARIAEAMGDAGRRCRVGLLLSGWYWQNGQHRLAAEAADRAVAATGGDRLTRALGLYRRGTNLQAVGDYAAAVAALREAIGLLGQGGAQEVFAFGGHPFVFCCSFLAWSLAELGEHAAAREEGERGWRAAARLGNSYSQAVMSFGHGHALIRAGALDEAEAVLERGLELYRIEEVPATYPWIAAGLGYVRVLKGEADAGMALLRHAIAPEVRRRGPLYAQTHLWLAEAAGHLRRHEEALATARTGHAVAMAQGERGHLAWAERILGDLLSATAPRAAAAHYERSLRIAADLGMRPQAELARAGLARLAAERASP